MSNSDHCRSEIACLRERIELEEQSIRLAMSGFAMTARHDFINARMERGGRRILRLVEAGKQEEALALMNTEHWGETETSLETPESHEQGGQ